MVWKGGSSKGKCAICRLGIVGTPHIICASCESMFCLWCAAENRNKHRPNHRAAGEPADKCPICGYTGKP